MSHFQDTNVQTHNSLSMTLQTSRIFLTGDDCELHVSLEWYSLLLSLSKRSESPQKIIICCADPQRICAIGAELWAPFHLKKKKYLKRLNRAPFVMRKQSLTSGYHSCEQPGICINSFKAIDRFLPGD